MAATSTQFAVATHIMAALAFHSDEPVNSRALAKSVNAEPTFVRKSVSKLAKAGLVVTTRGKNGACALARAPRKITLRDIYLASEAPSAFEVHAYPSEKNCPVSAKIKPCMASIRSAIQRSLEKSLSAITLAQVVADIRKRTNR